METLFGLPAHPLVVHIPIVLIPLCMVGAVGMWWKGWRDRFGWATVILLGVAGVATQLAITSGESLDEESERDALVRAHTSIAENIRPWLLLFFLAAIALLLLDRRRRATGVLPGGQAAFVGAYVAMLVFAGFSGYWIQRIGHSGAKAVWEEQQQRTNERPGGESGESNEGLGAPAPSGAAIGIP